MNKDQDYLIVKEDIRGKNYYIVSGFDSVKRWIDKSINEEHRISHVTMEVYKIGKREFRLNTHSGEDE